MNETEAMANAIVSDTEAFSTIIAERERLNRMISMQMGWHREALLKGKFRTPALMALRSRIETQWQKCIDLERDFEMKRLSDYMKQFI